MCRNGDCTDKAVAESFLELLEEERVKRKIYVIRDIARAVIFNNIAMLNNSRRRHEHDKRLSPIDFKAQCAARR